jgi:hypothetical protein
MAIDYVEYTYDEKELKGLSNCGIVYFDSTPHGSIFLDECQVEWIALIGELFF